MKNKKDFIATLILSIAFYGTAHAMPAPVPTEVLVGVSGAFVPDSQSSSDEAFVIPNGLFPNACYSWSRAETRHVTEFDHEIRSYAWVSGGPCLMYLVPFNHEVKLGKLAAGTHRVRFVSHDATSLEKRMVIR